MQIMTLQIYSPFLLGCIIILPSLASCSAGRVLTEGVPKPNYVVIEGDATATANTIMPNGNVVLKQSTMEETYQLGTLVMNAFRKVELSITNKNAWETENLITLAKDVRLIVQSKYPTNENFIHNEIAIDCDQSKLNFEIVGRLIREICELQPELWNYVDWATLGYAAYSYVVNLSLYAYSANKVGMTALHAFLSIKKKMQKNPWSDDDKSDFAQVIIDEVLTTPFYQDKKLALASDADVDKGIEWRSRLVLLGDRIRIMLSNSVARSKRFNFASIGYAAFLEVSALCTREEGEQPHGAEAASPSNVGV